MAEPPEDVTNSGIVNLILFIAGKTLAHLFIGASWALSTCLACHHLYLSTFMNHRWQIPSTSMFQNCF
jgi:hypothetical protein